MNLLLQERATGLGAAIRQAGSSSAAVSGQPAWSAAGKGRQLNGGELANLTAQLAIMTRSGVDVVSALESLARQCRRPKIAAVIHDVHRGVLEGSPLSQSLKRHQKVFGATYVATVAAGEASGQLSHVLGQLAHMQRSEQRMVRSIKALMAYPVLLASVSSLVMFALILFVLPQFAKIFEQYGTPLPWITSVLIFFSEELRTRWWLYGPLLIGLVGGAASLRFHAAGRRVWDWFLLHAWLISEVSRMLLVGRSCRLMGLMLGSGVPVLDALRLARDATHNTLYRELFDTLAEEVLNGRSLAASLAPAEIVPAMASEMIATAEKAGNLGEVALLIGEHFEEEGEAKLRQMVAVLEPVITVGMGLVVAVVVMAVMLPMFDLATFAQQH